MKRMFGLAVTLGAVLAGWAAIAGAQNPPAPPAPAEPVPVPAPVLPTTPGTVPTPSPIAPVAPVTMTPQPPAPAAPETPAPAQPPAPSQSDSPTPASPATPAPMPPQPTPMTAAPAQPAPVPMEQSSAQPIPAAIVTGQPVDPNVDLGPGQDANNPTGRQEPAVSIEWIGPASAKVGQACDYTILVRNACNIPVQQALVRVRLLGGAAVIATEPRAIAEENILMWEVGTLLPKQEKALQMRLMSNQRGDVAAQAWVTFTGSSAMRIKVREPKLAIKAAAPQKAMVGDTCIYTLTVNNPGDGVCEHVKLHTTLSDGLTHPSGNKIDYDLGNLAAGESRTVQVVCLTKNGGEQSCEVLAEANAGLKATDKAVAMVVVPRLDLEAKGPKLRYLDRKAVYTFKVTNPGDAPAANVMLSDVLPAGLKFAQADHGGRHDFATKTVSWFLGEIGPGQSKEVSVEVMCTATGEFLQKVHAQASRGLKVEGEAMTRVEGLSAVQLEMVDLEDPIELNGETIYEIRITNTGTKTETDVKLACTLPADKMEFKTATGPTPFAVVGNEVVFEPLAKLAPRADAIYRVTVKCKAAGIAHFKSRITSAILTDPVTKEEATRIYAD